MMAFKRRSFYSKNDWNWICTDIVGGLDALDYLLVLVRVSEDDGHFLIRKMIEIVFFMMLLAEVSCLGVMRLLGHPASFNNSVSIMVCPVPPALDLRKMMPWQRRSF